MSVCGPVYGVLIAWPHLGRFQWTGQQQFPAVTIQRYPNYPTYSCVLVKINGHISTRSSNNGTAVSRSQTVPNWPSTVTYRTRPMNARWCAAVLPALSMKETSRSSMLLTHWLMGCTRYDPTDPTAPMHYWVRRNKMKSGSVQQEKKTMPAQDATLRDVIRTGSYSYRSRGP